MPIIDLSQLPAPSVVETLDYETLLATRKETLLCFTAQRSAKPSPAR